jgi:hypothetical protein
MAAGEQPCVWTELLQQDEGVLDRLRALVAERCWNLQDSSLVSLRRSASGVTVDLSTRVK